MALPTLPTLLREIVDVPEVDVPPGRWLDLPGRGRTWLTDVPGPEPDAPSGDPAARRRLHRPAHLVPGGPGAAPGRYRVVVFDQRWHGRGIVSEHFSIRDCADDVAAVADAARPRGADRGRLLDGLDRRAALLAPAPRAASAALVLAATTDHFRTTGRETVFHEGMELGMGALRTLSRSQDHQRRRPGDDRGAPEPQRHPRVGAPGVAQHQLLGGGAGGGLARPAPLDPLAVAASTSPRPSWSPRRTACSPPSASAAIAAHDPRRHRARGSLRPRGLRAPGRCVRAGRSSKRSTPRWAAGRASWSASG